MGLGIGGSVVARAKAVIEADTKGFEKGLDNSERRFKKHAATIGKIGVGMTAAAAIGAKKAVDAYSDFHEEVNKTEVVFGKASKAVIDFTDNSAKKLGQTRTEALQFANNFGNMLVPMGLSRKAAAGLSTSLVQLSSDMASFNNAAPTDVLQALQSGLAGQVRPLRQFGVFLSKDRIEAEAFSSGIAKSTKNLTEIKDANLKVAITQAAYTAAVKKHGPASEEAKKATISLDRANAALAKALQGHHEKLTQQQKTLATYRIIMKDTKDAQGDFARTSDGAANRSRILTAEIGNLEEEMGGALYPTFTKILGGLISFGQLMERHQTIVKTAIPVLGALGIALFTLSLAVKAYTFATSQATASTLKFMLALATNPITLVVLALAALGVALVEAYKHSETFRRIVNGAFEKVRAVASAVFDFIRAHWQILLVAMGLGIIPVVVKVVQNFTRIREAVGGVIDAIRHAFSSLWSWLVDTSLEVALKLVEPFSHLPGKMGGWARRAKDAINAELDEIHPAKVSLHVRGGKFTETIKDRHGHSTVITGDLLEGLAHADGGRIRTGRSDADSVPALLAKNEFVVTGGGERMLESLTFPGVLDWLEGAQPRHFAGGGRVGAVASGIGAAVGSMSSYGLSSMVKSPELLGEFADTLFNAAAAMFGGAVSTSGLVPQVTRALAYARAHGWRGSVTSGFRSYAEQAALYQRYLAGGPLAAKPGTSSHERGQAVDVSDYSTFGAIMAGAPPFERLYNFLGAADPVHFSVSGYAKGGRAKPKKKAPPKTPPKTPAPIRAREQAAKGSPSKKDDVRALQAEKAWIIQQLRNPRLSKAQKAELRVRLASVNAKLARAKAGVASQAQEARTHDYSALPPAIQLAIAKAHRTTNTTADDATALGAAHAFLVKQLKRPGLTDSQKAQIIDALTDIEAQQADLVQTPGDTDYSAIPDDLALALALAEGTDDTGDDLAALGAEESFLVGQLSAAPDAAHKLPVVQALNDVRSKIKSLVGGGSAASTEPGAPSGAALDALRDAAGASMLASAQSYGSNIFGPSVGGNPGRGSVTVVQNFTRQPEDPFVWLKKSSFAAQAAFG